MDLLEYAEDNLLGMATSPRFKQYARGNPKAEVEFGHALDVSFLARELWLRKFGAIPPLALKIAGYFHDCDRFFPEEKVDTTVVSLNLYEAAKLEHSKNCARIFSRENPKLPRPLKIDTSYMIERHEIGGEKVNGKHVELADRFTKSFDVNVSSDQLTEADGLGFFRGILPSYVKWASPEKVVKKIEFSFGKLSPEGQQMVREMNFADEQLRNIVLETVGKAS